LKEGKQIEQATSKKGVARARPRTLPAADGIAEPWKVTEVKVDFDGLKVDVWVEWPAEQQGVCPECGKGCRIYDHRDERQWRHLDTMQFQTILHCRVPRVNCPEHGTKSMDIPWAEKSSRFTALFERLSIDVLLGCQNQSQAKELLKLSWDEVHLIQEKAVKRGLGRRVSGELKYIGVDEKSFLKGHRYATVLSDLDNSREDHMIIPSQTSTITFVIGSTHRGDSNVIAD